MKKFDCRFQQYYCTKQLRFSGVDSHSPARWDIIVFSLPGANRRTEEEQEKAVAWLMTNRPQRWATVVKGKAITTMATTSQNGSRYLCCFWAVKKADTSIPQCRLAVCIKVVLKVRVRIYKDMISEDVHKRCSKQTRESCDKHAYA